MRIAIAGFQHETNTFAPHKAHYADFLEADAWPGMTRGSAVITALAGMNLPISGFAAKAQAKGVDLAPLLWCSAEPSSYVTEDAFTRVSDELCDGLKNLSNLDALYLDLHGAMVTESHEDGEGALLAKIRGIVGPELPIVVSLDLHANVTKTMFDLADAMTIFRTYPHLDMAETGARVFTLLEALLAGQLRGKAFRQSPFLVPLTDQYTGQDPCRSLYAGLPGLCQDKIVNIDLAMGFPAADIKDAGPALIAYGTDTEATETAAQTLLERFMAAESCFGAPLQSAEDAVAQAVQSQSSKTHRSCRCAGQPWRRRDLRYGGIARGAGRWRRATCRFGTAS